MKKYNLIISNVVIAVFLMLTLTTTSNAQTPLKNLKQSAESKKNRAERQAKKVDDMNIPKMFSASKSWYVSIETGKNKNDGTKESPFKNIQKAINTATDGDVIHVAQGNYLGLMDIGFITVDKPLAIIAGYDNNFEERDPLKYKTTIQTTPIHAPTSNSKCLINIAYSKGNCLIDGFIMDRGLANGYNVKDGKPDGLPTGMYELPPRAGVNQSFSGVISVAMAILHFNIDEGDVTIKNCVFTNGMNYGVRGSVRIGNVKIINNLFVCCGMSAVEVFGKSAKSVKDSKLEFAHNTVLFTWTRTKELDDMGYGVRFMTGIINDFHDNIIGLSSFGGVDRTRSDSDSKREKDRIQKLDNNVFFLNKKGDMVLPSGGGHYLWIPVDNFDDVETLKSIEGNVELSADDASKISSKINQKYLEAYLAATYKEELSYDANSSSNRISRALGGNQSGTMKSKVSMFGNWYPLEEALKLIDILPERGMQSTIK